MHHPFLVGERIYLRRVEKGDLEGNYYQWLNDQEVTRWMQNGIFPNSAESMLEYHQYMVGSRTDMNLAIVVKDGDQHIGNISIGSLNQMFRSAEIGILIGEKNAWGQGYGSDAIALLAGHAFQRMNLNRLGSGTVAENTGCIRAFEKAGFMREGISRQAYFCEGQYRDCVLMGLLRCEWNEK